VDPRFHLDRTPKELDHATFRMESALQHCGAVLLSQVTLNATHGDEVRADKEIFVHYFNMITFRDQTRVSQGNDPGLSALDSDAPNSDGVSEIPNMSSTQGNDRIKAGAPPSPNGHLKAGAPPSQAASEHGDALQFRASHSLSNCWIVVASCCAALVAWVFWPTIIELAEIWANNPLYSHGYFIPCFAAVLLWMRRERISVGSLQPSYWGFALVVLGVALRLGGA
jgi:hypothetical protein